MNFTKEDILKEIKSPSNSDISLLIQPLSVLKTNNFISDEDIKYLKKINTEKNYIQNRTFEIEVNVTDFALFSATLNTGQGKIYIDILKYIDIIKEIKDNNKIKHKNKYFYIFINKKYIKIKEDKFITIMKHLVKKNIYIDSYKLLKSLNINTGNLQNLSLKRAVIENVVENKNILKDIQLFQQTGNTEDIKLNFVIYKIFREGRNQDPYNINFKIEEEHRKNAQKFIKRLSTTNIMKTYYELEKIILISPLSVVIPMVDEVIKFSSSIETIATVINHFHSVIKDIFYFYIINYIITTKIESLSEYNSKVLNVVNLLKNLDVNLKLTKKIIIKYLKRKKHYYYHIVEMLVKKSVDINFYKRINKVLKNIDTDIFIYENYSLNERIELLDKYNELLNIIKKDIKEENVNVNKKIKIPDINNFYNFIRYLTPLEIKSIELDDKIKKLIVEDYKNNFPEDYISIRNFILFIDKIKVEDWMIEKIEEMCKSKYEDIRLIGNSCLSNIKIKQMEQKELEEGEIQKKDVERRRNFDCKNIKRQKEFDGYYKRY